MDEAPIETESRKLEFRANVRFSESEYKRLLRDQAASGHSIPWLLKTAYFSKNLAPPTLDAETRSAVTRELNHIGNNVNQIARQANAGIIRGIQRDVAEMLKLLEVLRSFLTRDYGDPYPAKLARGETRR